MNTSPTSKERLLAVSLLSLIVVLPAAIALVWGMQTLLNLIFVYPLLMSFIWMSGGLYFWLHWERDWTWRPAPAPDLPGTPRVTILVPCFNEEEHGEETLRAALAQNYPNVEVIAINDGSRDGTAALLDRLVQDCEGLRVIHLASNQGKAMALRMGAMAATSDLLVCIDGDARLDPDALRYLVAPLVMHQRVGAVTGNPRIRTRSTLIGRIQVGEFSSIVGLIKRTQRIYGQLFTVSGVCTAFRREALDQVGYWSLDMITEDIDITWKLQRANWRVFYEPRALCWILMPETLAGLWKQRLRWAQGGSEVLLKFLPLIRHRQHRKLWIPALEYLLSTVWSFAVAWAVLIWVTHQALALGASLDPALLFHQNIVQELPALLPPAPGGLLLAATCLLQFAVSVFIEHRYEPGLIRSLFWIVWYPFVYWLVNLATTLVSFPKVMLRKGRPRARWVSPDRGIKELT